LLIQYSMRLRLLVCFLFLGFSFNEIKASPAVSSPHDSITVYVFLLEDCIISQNYTDLLNRLAVEYKDKKVGFLGLFPSSFSRDSTIKAFSAKYHIAFPLKTDHYQTMTKKLGVTITPEVAVFDQVNNVLLYRGRINNQYERVGKRRSVPSTSELEDVLKSWANNKPLAFYETKAVGCFIKTNKIP